MVFSDVKGFAVVCGRFVGLYHDWSLHGTGLKFAVGGAVLNPKP